MALFMKTLISKSCLVGYCSSKVPYFYVRKEKVKTENLEDCREHLFTGFYYSIRLS